MRRRVHTFACLATGAVLLGGGGMCVVKSLGLLRVCDVQVALFFGVFIVYFLVPFAACNESCVCVEGGSNCKGLGVQVQAQLLQAQLLAGSDLLLFLLLLLLLQIGYRVSKHHNFLIHFFSSLLHSLKFIGLKVFWSLPMCGVLQHEWYFLFFPLSTFLWPFVQVQINGGVFRFCFLL